MLTQTIADPLVYAAMLCAGLTPVAFIADRIAAVRWWLACR